MNRTRICKRIEFCVGDALTTYLDKFKVENATLIYAGSQLYEITGDETYYNLTKATVEASVPHMFRVSDGDINMNGNPIFKAGVSVGLQGAM